MIAVIVRATSVMIGIMTAAGTVTGVGNAIDGMIATDATTVEVARTAIAVERGAGAVTGTVTAEATVSRAVTGLATRTEKRTKTRIKTAGNVIEEIVRTVAAAETATGTEAPVLTVAQAAGMLQAQWRRRMTKASAMKQLEA